MLKFKKKDNTVGLLIVAAGLVLIAIDRKAKANREKEVKGERAC